MYTCSTVSHLVFILLEWFSEWNAFIPHTLGKFFLWLQQQYGAKKSKIIFIKKERNKNKRYLYSKKGETNSFSQLAIVLRHYFVIPGFL